MKQNTVLQRQKVIVKRPTDFALGLGTLLLVAASAAVVLLAPRFRHEPSRTTFALKAVDDGGRLRVDWDPGDDLIRASEAGTLEVNDGGALHRYPLDRRILASGGLDYLRRSDEVLLTLTLQKEGKQTARSMLRSVAPTPEPPEPEVQTDNRRRSGAQQRSRRR